MDKLPFALNFFKQIEYFQDVKRLDNQFDKMLSKWKSGGYKKFRLSKNVNINYPTWELEKKILLWTAENHKHLGSAITTSHPSDPKFQEEIHATETELEFAGKEEILRNLVARGMAVWKKGAVISEKGLGYGLLIAGLYELKKDETIKEGEAKYREELLRKIRRRWLGYDLIYYSGILLILVTLLFLGLSISKIANPEILFIKGAIKAILKWMVVIIGFLPFTLFLVGLLLMKL